MDLRRSWGYAAALLDRSRRFAWVDLVFVVGLVGVLYGWIDLATEWTGPHKAEIAIDLDDPWALPEYTFYSLSRGLIAYVISLGFTLIYGYWAAKDHRAERLLVPLLDILQSIPVLSFLPGLVLALVGLFPNSNVGLELAAVIMIFTGQAWNMTFSFYHSLRSVPKDLQEVATVYHLNWWQRFKWLELPFSTMGLVWNSMMSMAGGWFFLMINEAFQLGKNRDFRLPGLGSYMSVAVDQGRFDAMILAVLAMFGMIITLDQLLWRPVVVWAQKFRVEEGGQQPAMSSWFLNWLRRSEILAALGRLLRWLKPRERPRTVNLEEAMEKSPRFSAVGSLVSPLALLLLLGFLAFGAWKIINLLESVTLGQWGETVGLGFYTLGRVLVAVALGTLWAVPAGLAIGLSPRLSRLMQPVVQILASFPAPMLFPLVIWGLGLAAIPNWGSILLMLLGTQWYILFNVIAGTMAIPADLREASRSYRMGLWQRFWVLYYPAIFPFLVTGWITAAGGAWNASIVAEYVVFRGKILMEATGLGAQISATLVPETPEYALLGASTIVMSLLVVTFNRFVWRRLYRLAEERYSLNK